MPRSETAASDGWRPASWTPWRASAYPPSATASATTTDSSSSKSATAGNDELPEDWLSAGNPWEFERPELTYPIGFGGAVEYVGGIADNAHGIWYPAETVLAVAHDTPVVGWRGRHVNTLRLWSAHASDPIQLKALQPRRLCRSDGRARKRGSHLARALSQRRDAGRTGAAPAAGVLLHLGVVAGHRATSPASTTRAWTPCRRRRPSSSTTPIRRSRLPS